MPVSVASQESHARQMQNGTPSPPPSDARLTLTTLGGWSLAYAPPGQPPAPALGPGKPLALIVYLALAPGRAARREHLLDLLWADVDPDAAAHAMRQTIWLIRRRLGRETLRVAGDSVQLAGAVETDRDAFLAALQAQDFAAAVAMYHGEFLPSFAAPGGAEFEKWADLERGRLRAQFVHACQALARCRLEAGHPRDALAHARRARDADRSVEASWRLVLEACISANDPIAAALEADELERSLAAASREPEPATRWLLRAVRHAPPPSAGEARARTLVAELVGREREFAAILAAWASARRSPGRQLHVSAGPGLGKTRLLRDVLARLRATGARALYARANPGARNVAYAFASDLAAQLAAFPGATGISPGCAATLVALNPVIASRFAVAPERSDGDEALRHRGSAMAELLAAAAGEDPVALLLDDVHWADAMSRQVLRAMLARLEDLPALVVTTARPGTADDLAAPDATLTLAPLTGSETVALLASLASIPAESWWAEFCTALHASCRGVPLLILEMLQLAIERGDLARDESGWSTRDGRGLLELVGQGGPVRHRIEQLSREHRWLLLVLAVAGAPLGATALVAASGRKPEDVDEDLNQLEQRGLLRRVGGDWEPGHDEVAHLAAQLAAPEALRAAHAALGQLRLVEAERDPRLLVHAGQHLSAAGMQAELGTAVRRWARHRRRQGDRRRLAEIAADLLANHPRKEEARELVRRLPLSYRITGGRPARVLGAAGLVVAAAAATLLVARGPAPRPDAVIVRLAPLGGDSVTTTAVGLRLESLGGGVPLDLGGLPRISTGLPGAMPAPFGAAVPKPGGGSWLYARASPDSGGLDVYAIGDDGRERRLTATRGDDEDPAWSPDGRRIVFSTDRWSAAAHSAIAVMDADGGRVRRLTSGDARNVEPVWSPDGTRIAFLRRSYTSPEKDVCWVTPDEAITRCRALADLSNLVGWRDASRLVVQVADSAGPQWLLTLDLTTSQLAPIARGDQASLSPDGRWLLLRTDDPASDPRFRLVPLDRPDLARPVVAESLARRGLVQVVTAPRWTPGYLDSLAILGPTARDIPVGGTFKLTARGADAHGVPVAPAVLTWTSGDTSVAEVDSSGVVHPRRAGEVAITATAGGWRSVTLRVAVAASADSTVFRETWGEPLESSWVPFGDPRPEIVTGPGGVASLWHHGDSNFTSGVYSRREFDPSRGLGVEARLSTPVARTTWQDVYVELVEVTDVAALARWDHRTGWLPKGTVSDYRVCQALLPAGEGAAAANDLSASLGGAGASIPVGPALRSGRWWRLRLQVFPDGRCGVAVNGRAVWRSRSAMPLDRGLRLFVHGYSYRTRILAGPLEVWEGVRRDVDWERTAAR